MADRTAHLWPNDISDNSGLATEEKSTSQVKIAKRLTLAYPQINFIGRFTIKPERLKVNWQRKQICYQVEQSRERD